MTDAPILETTNCGPLNVVSVPCLNDNFGYLLHDPETGSTASIDAPEAEPLEGALRQLGWSLSHVLITHHHNDHVGGVEQLRKLGDVAVIGSKADARRLPPLDLALMPGETWQFGAHDVQVIDTPGHTVGHVSFYLPSAGILFSGDTMFAAGCGRLFEGTAQQMWGSLSRLAQLPPETHVFFGHEYTASNLRFALTVDADNAALRERAAAAEATLAGGGRTTPTTIGEERATNPFLRAASADIARKVGLPDADPAIVFAEVRRLKDAG